jgi:Tfp pilus assembly protein PilN
MADLNLFTDKLSKLRKKQKIRSLGWRIILGLVVLLTCLLIGLSSYSLLVARNNQRLAIRIDTAKKEINDLKTIETKQAYLISKIDTFGDLLVTQEKHQAIAEAIFSLIPNGTSLKGFQVAEDGFVTLSGSVPDYPTLLSLMERIKNSQELNLPVLSAKVNTISFGGSAGINFAIEVLIGV